MNELSGWVPGEEDPGRSEVVLTQDGTLCRICRNGLMIGIGPWGKIAICWYCDLEKGKLPGHFTVKRMGE